MLTPDEIELKTFPVTLRGFDQAEVTAFLRDVAAQLQSALDQAREMQAASALRESADRSNVAVIDAAEIVREETNNFFPKPGGEASSPLDAAKRTVDEFMAKTTAHELDSIAWHSFLRDVAAQLKHTAAHLADAVRAGTTLKGPAERENIAAIDTADTFHRAS
jgi:DivIVA domain-containing protein